MAKKALAPQSLIPVRPILIVGANIDGKPNFFEVGGGGTISADPPTVAVPIRHQRYTLRGILENRTFSVNIPSAGYIKEADYCGIVSGDKTDKVRDCSMDVFYGKLISAPMIEQCPINLECSVLHILGSTSHCTIIGRVDGTYISSEYAKEEKPDWGMINPLLWFPERNEYFTIGQAIGKVRDAGNELKNGIRHNLK